MKERFDKLRTIENYSFTNYKPVIVHSQITSLEEFGVDIRERLSGVEGTIAVKGGFARELFRFNLGLTTEFNYEKLKDLDIVVFETPSQIRKERIDRRNQIVSLSEYFEPKDIEICDSTPAGLVHFFKTRDVTMNELVMFKRENNIQFLYSQECREDLTNRIIRPSIHLAHTGLGIVWFQQEEKKLLSAIIVGRCIYRKIKGDGDIFVSDEINFYDSAKALSSDELFKITKRFAESPQLLERCMQIYKEIGINDELLAKVIEKIQDPKVKKSRGIITSEIVENMLDERAIDYQKWFQDASESQKVTAEVIFNFN